MVNEGPKGHTNLVGKWVISNKKTHGTNADHVKN